MFNFAFDKRTITIVFAVILGLWLISAGIEGVLTIPGILIALTFHEFAHAWAATKLGDETPRVQGRLNLNPLNHIDPVGFIFLIVAGFGWGKPVQIDPRNFNGKHSISKAEAIVSAAGPIMNFIIAFIFLIFTNLIFIYWPEANEQYHLYMYGVISITAMGWPGLICLIVHSIATINIFLGVFNLIPIPPLDGSKILMHFLPYKGKEWFYRNERYFYLVFLIIVMAERLGYHIISPIFEVAHEGLVILVQYIFKLFI